MQNVFINQLLNSLSFALINSLWQMAFLWICYQIVVALFNLTSKNKYIILMMLQMFGFSWFIITLAKTIDSGGALSNNNFMLFSIFKNNETIAKFFPLLSVIYLFFVLVFFSKLMLQIFNTNHRAKSYQNYTSPQWNKFIDQVAFKLNISKKIILKTTTQNVVPFTIGFLKPVIILPLAAINNLSAKQLEAILIHELAHIKRQDYFTNILLLLIDAIMCFNPFSKFFNKEIFAERELCCDDVVINYPFETSQYAQALLNISKSQITPQIYATSLGAFETKQHLLYRINRMFYGENFNYGKKVFRYQFFIALFFGFSMFALIGIINNSVKTVISHASKSTIISKYQFLPINFKRKKNSTRNIEICVVSTKINKSNKSNSNELKDEILSFKRTIIQKGFTDLAKAIENENSIMTSVKSNETNFILDTTSTQDIAITQAVNKQNNIIVERFFVPATSQSAASIIVVTTIIKDDGSKKVKIEIEKGSGKVE